MSNTSKPQVTITENFVSDHAALFESLKNEVEWETSMSARHTASFGVPYNYSQMVYAEQPFHPLLVSLRAKLVKALSIEFNNCLLNYYLNDRSKMGFHSDETENLVEGSGVAIVSVGEERAIHFRNRDDPQQLHSFMLSPGSLLFMGIDVQHHWAHAIKKRKHAGERISLTWRAFKT